MKILLTNDDGVFARGIWELANALKSKHDVIISAPDSNRSGAALCPFVRHREAGRGVRSLPMDTGVWIGFCPGLFGTVCPDRIEYSE